MTLEIPSVSEKKNSVPLICNWPITLFSAGILPILIALGSWQLQRAEYKEIIKKELDEKLSSQPINPDTGVELERFIPVVLTGHYTEEYYFLDNRTRQGRAGYEVLQLFISNNRRWLINRGWVPQTESRQILPEISYPRNTIKIIGYISPVSNSNSVDEKEKEKEKEKDNIRRVQSIDKNLTRHLQVSENNWIIRISSDSISAFVTGWKFTNSGPERHRAYAVQWFSMAIALIILWMFSATEIVRLSRKIIMINR
ncbi:SURF1 family protein [Microbulbifer echini]|uniref:SURF1-like protein n=1 Tax=Microbulbifer echini TaxID=1529067 RepID=A0ABV4NJ70_9GAMM